MSALYPYKNKQNVNLALAVFDAEMEVGSGFSGRVRVGPGSGRVSGLTFQREIGLNRGHTS